MRPDIKKRREKYEAPTMSQNVVGEMDLLLARPFGMDFDLYKQARYYQSRLLRELHKSAPDEQIARVMQPKVPSLHMQRMVFNARMKKIDEAEARLPKETPAQRGGLDLIFNFFRRLTGRTHEA